MSWYSSGRHYAYIFSVFIAVIIFLGLFGSTLSFFGGNKDITGYAIESVTPWPIQLIIDWGAVGVIVILVIVAICKFFHVLLPWKR